MKKEIEFKSGDLVLKGTLFLPQQASFGGVIFYHGSGSSRKNYLPIAEALIEKGIASLAFDFRGCGSSDGQFAESTVNDNIIDGQAALDFLLKQKGIKPKSIGLVGVSRGGHVAAVIAGQNPNVISLILRAPVAYPKDVADKSKSEMPGKEWIKDKSKWENSPALAGIQNFKNFLLIVASENDDIVPLEMVTEYKNRSGAMFSEIQTITGAGHSLGDLGSAYREEFKKMVVTWFIRGTDLEEK